MKPVVIFFSRNYQANLFPKLKSKSYNSIYVAYNRSEKKIIERNGAICHACFEELYDDLEMAPFDNTYLDTSFTSDRFFGCFSLDDRILYLRKSISFWNYVYDKYKPSAIVNEVIAIEFSEVSYIEARKRNISYLSWMVSPFPDKQFYWLSVPFHASLDKAVFDSEPAQESKVYALKYLKTLIEEDLRPFYIQGLRKRKNPIILLSSIAALFKNYFKSIIKKKNTQLFYFNSSRFIKNRILAYFNSFLYHYDSISKNKEYCFYPLHYEPEASLTYFAEFKDYQLNTIRNISKCLKLDQYLVVKEHPQQPGVLLSKEFRKLRKTLSNIIYLPAEYPTKKLIKQVKYVVTISSTAGWEALLMGKPTFVFGKVFYDKHTQVNRINSFCELKSLIKNDEYLTPSIKDTIDYISKFYEYCCFGNPYPNKTLYDIQNIDLLVKAIEKKLNAIHL